MLFELPSLTRKSRSEGRKKNEKEKGEEV